MLGHLIWLLETEQVRIQFVGDVLFEEKCVEEEIEHP